MPFFQLFLPVLLLLLLVFSVFPTCLLLMFIVSRRWSALGEDRVQAGMEGF